MLYDEINGLHPQALGVRHRAAAQRADLRHRSAVPPHARHAAAAEAVAARHRLRLLQLIEADGAFLVTRVAAAPTAARSRAASAALRGGSRRRARRRLDRLGSLDSLDALRLVPAFQCSVWHARLQ